MGFNMQAVMQFGGLDWITVLFFLVAAFGYARMFKKCGAPRYWAFVPVIRDYWIGKCADRETEGKMVVLSKTLGYLLLLGTGLTLGERVDLIVFPILISLQAVLLIVMVVYQLRLQIGLCDMMGRRRLWVLVLFFAEPVAALVFGFGRCVPQYKIQEKEKNAAPVGDGFAIREKEGLSVNITERPVYEGLNKRLLLQDIHLAIRPGRMVLLLGSSGAGKTTFIHAVTGYEKAKGTITLDDKDVYKEYKKIQHQIGMVPQQNLVRFHDLVSKTVADAAAIRLPLSVPAKERQKKVEAVLDQVGLLRSQGHKIRKLSGGQLRRLSIAMELVSDPELFILDEPDSGLDGIMARGLMKDLRRIADSGKIVMVITHTPDRVIDLFDDVIVLAKDANNVGRLAFFGPVGEARTFFGCERMEEILSQINRKGDGGEGRGDEYIMKYEERRRKEEEDGKEG